MAGNISCHSANLADLKTRKRWMCLISTLRKPSRMSSLSVCERKSKDWSESLPFTHFNVWKKNCSEQKLVNFNHTKLLRAPKNVDKCFGKMIQLERFHNLIGENMWEMCVSISSDKSRQNLFLAFSRIFFFNISTSRQKQTFCYTRNFFGQFFTNANWRHRLGVRLYF